MYINWYINPIWNLREHFILAEWMLQYQNRYSVLIILYYTSYHQVSTGYHSPYSSTGQPPPDLKLPVACFAPAVPEQTGLAKLTTLHPTVPEKVWYQIEANEYVTSKSMKSLSTRFWGGCFNFETHPISYRCFLATLPAETSPTRTAEDLGSCSRSCLSWGRI